MKIRNGFVSNSSSSSFVVTRSGATTAEVAIMMLFEVLSDGMEYDFYESDRDGIIRAAIDWLDRNQQYNEPIWIPWTCNYSTYIWRNDYICVDTCNNQCWDCVGPKDDIGHHCRPPIGKDDDPEDKFYEGREGKYLDLSSMKVVDKQELAWA